MLKNEQTLLKKKRLNLLANLLIAAMGVSSLFIKFFLVDGALAFRAFTVDGNLFTTIVAIIYVFTEWRDLRQKKETQSTLLYFLKICSAVTEAVIFIVVMIGYLPIFKDNPKITPYHMFCLHVSIPIVTVLAFIFFNSPRGVLKPFKLVYGCIPILVYAVGVCVAIKTKLLPIAFVPYSFLNFDENYLWYMSFALVVILFFGYFWTWLFYRLNLRMAVRWYKEEDIRAAERQRLNTLTSADTVNSTLMLLLFGIAGILVTVILAMSGKTNESMSNAFLDYIIYDDYLILEEDYFPEGDWQLRDGTLYRGEVPFGDGTAEHANRDASLNVWSHYLLGFYMNTGEPVEFTDPALTEEGRFILVTESLLDGEQKNESIGTAMPADIVQAAVDSLAIDSNYPGANVAEKIYGVDYRSVYAPLKDGTGKVVAFVRASVKKAAITSLVKSYSGFAEVIMIMAALIAFAVVYIMTRRIVVAFSRMSTYLQTVCEGKKPAEALYLGKGKRYEQLARQINDFVDGLGQSGEETANDEENNMQ